MFSLNVTRRAKRLHHHEGRDSSRMVYEAVKWKVRAHWAPFSKQTWQTLHLPLQARALDCCIGTLNNNVEHKTPNHLQSRWKIWDWILWICYIVSLACTWSCQLAVFIRVEVLSFNLNQFIMQCLHDDVRLLLLQCVTKTMAWWEKFFQQFSTKNINKRIAKSIFLLPRRNLMFARNINKFPATFHFVSMCAVSELSDASVMMTDIARKERNFFMFKELPHHNSSSAVMMARWHLRILQNKSCRR